MNKDFNRRTCFIWINVTNSNPNGDPEGESKLFTRQNGCREISSLSFKRKLRDLLKEELK